MLASEIQKEAIPQTARVSPFLEIGHIPPWADRNLKDNCSVLDQGAELHSTHRYQRALVQLSLFSPNEYRIILNPQTSAPKKDRQFSDNLEMESRNI